MCNTVQACTYWSQLLGDSFTPWCTVVSWLGLLNLRWVITFSCKIVIAIDKRYSNKSNNTCMPGISHQKWLFAVMWNAPKIKGRLGSKVVVTLINGWGCYIPKLSSPLRQSSFPAVLSWLPHFGKQGERFWGTIFFLDSIFQKCSLVHNLRHSFSFLSILRYYLIKDCSWAGRGGTLLD